MPEIVQDIPGIRATNSGLPGDVPDTDQAAKRSYAFYRDQHGRNWGAVIENRTGDPCGPMEPEFSAPLRVHDKYIKIDKRSRTIHIMYENVIRDLQERQREWHNELTKTAQEQYGPGAANAIANPPPHLLALVGPPPPPTEPYEAALAGNQWVLGLAKEKPEWAMQFFPDKPQRAAVEPIRVDPSRFPDAGGKVSAKQVEKAEKVAAEGGPANQTGWPKWNIGKKEWQIGPDEFLERTPGESKLDYKRRALAAV